MAFWVAFGTALSINVLIEVVRHLRHRGDGVLLPIDVDAERTS